MGSPKGWPWHHPHGQPLQALPRAWQSFPELRAGVSAQIPHLPAGFQAQIPQDIFFPQFLKLILLVKEENICLNAE